MMMFVLSDLDENIVKFPKILGKLVDKLLYHSDRRCQFCDVDYRSRRVENLELVEDQVSNSITSILP